MSAPMDPSEFIDGDVQAARQAGSPAQGAATSRAPTRAEVDSKVTDIQQELTRIQQIKEGLERERAGLEETRRRQAEVHTGRDEMIQQITRGIGLLEEAELNARRDAEQMTRSIAGLREALDKVQAIHEEGWTKDNFQVELTRALTTLENARNEMNGARVRFPILSASPGESPGTTGPKAFGAPASSPDFLQQCQAGLAATWPVVIVLVAILLALLRQK